MKVGVVKKYLDVCAVFGHSLLTEKSDPQELAFLRVDTKNELPRLLTPDVLLELNVGITGWKVKKKVSLCRKKAMTKLDHSTIQPCTAFDAQDRCGKPSRKLNLKILKELRTGKGGHPLIIADFFERLDEWAHNPNLYPEFTRAISANGVYVRLEGRQGVVRVIKALLYGTELATLLVGAPRHQGFGMRYWSIAKTIENVVDVNKRTFERVLTRLYNAGLVTSAKQGEYDHESGEYVNYPSIRCISEKLFTLFNFTKERIKEQRQKASDRLKAFAARHGKKLKDLVKRPKSKPAKDTGWKDPKADMFAKARDIAKERHPDATPVELLTIIPQIVAELSS